MSEQLLTFRLADQEYGLDILRVQELKGWDEVTRLPNTPAYVKGVLNLRGTIVPIIDLRARFDLPAMAYDARTVVVVLRAERANGARTLGLVVDAVSDVHSLTQEMTCPRPDRCGSVDVSFVRGLALVDGKMVIVLDIDGLLAAT